MIKRTIALLLVLLMTFSLTACVTKNGDSVSGTQDGAATTKEDVKPDEPVKVYILTKVEAGTALPDDKLVLDHIINETGVEPIMIKPPAGTYDQKLNIMISSGDPLDAFICLPDYYDYQNKGLIRPLNDLLDNYGQNIKNLIKKPAWDTVTDKKTGDIYVVPFSSGTPIGNAPRVRMDWLEKLELGMPTTLEEFETVLEALKTTDKLGKNVIPLVTHLGASQLDRAFAGLWTKHGDHNWIDSDGRVKPAVLDPGYKDFIAKIAEWYEKGYIWKEAFTQEYTVINDLVAQNRVGILATWNSVGLNGIGSLIENGETADYRHMKEFTGPAGSAYSLRLPLPQGIAISTKSKNPEATIKFFNWCIASMTNRSTIDNGLENVHWKWVDEEKGIYELISGTDKRYSGIYSLFNGGSDMPLSGTSVMGQLWAQIQRFMADPSLKLKLPGDYGVVYDEERINSTVPSVSDIEKLRDKWLVNFIMGQEPMSKWDQFINELRSIGLDKMIDERTRQYNEQK